MLHVFIVHLITFAGWATILSLVVTLVMGVF